MLFAVDTAYRNDAIVCPKCDKEELANSRLLCPFYSSTRYPGYLTAYKLFVGDVNAKDCSASALSKVLFVAVTFLGVIIILNMLIVLVLESYERCHYRNSLVEHESRLSRKAFYWKRFCDPNPV
jgi:hypothetical protein